MTTRLLLRTGAQIGVVSLAAVVGAAQSRWSPPRTAWGDPDLQGVWTSDDMRGVPLQRQDEYGDRLYLTDEEYAKRVAQNDQARTAELNRVGAFRNDVGTRTFRQTSIVVDPPNGKIPAMTPEGQRRAAAVARMRAQRPSSWEDRSLYDRCITRGVVGSTLPVIYGNGNRIVQAPGYVAISYEMVHDTRIIPLDRRPHLGSSIRQYLGDARGHFEGDTLVVETTNFTDKTGTGLNGGGVPHSDGMRLAERFTRVDANTIQYEATIDDPKTYTRPWKVALPLTTQPGYQIFPYECHEGNHALADILSAARSEDKAVEEAIRKGLPLPTSVWQGNFGAVAAAQAEAER